MTTVAMAVTMAMAMAAAKTMGSLVVVDSHNDGRGFLVGVIKLDHWKRLNRYSLAALAQVIIWANTAFEAVPHDWG